MTQAGFIYVMVTVGAFLAFLTTLFAGLRSSRKDNPKLPECANKNSNVCVATGCYGRSCIK